MKYEEIVRLSNDELKAIDRVKQMEGKIKAIQKILDFYKPHFINIIKEHDITHYDETSLDTSLDNIEIDFNDRNMNKRPNYLSVQIRCKLFRFNLEELFNNCGVLVSTDTYCYTGKKGIGKVLHCIKEDIAYLFNYSFMMYTDTVFETIIKYNHKLLNEIGAKEVFRGLNTRSSNNIAVWIKDITAFYKERDKIINKVETTVQQNVESVLTEF